MNNKNRDIKWALMNTNVRLTNGDKWLWFDESKDEWVVSEKVRGAKNTKELYRGNENDAVKTLCSE